MSGRILLVATPIGNLGDASARLRDVMATADVLAAEDTRTARHLARALGVEISGEVMAVHDHNERDRAGDLVQRALSGATVALMTDAGMPTVSDPGYRVVEAAIAAGVEVQVVPGPSAVLAALAVSGLPTDRFSFEGFVPRKAGERAAFLAELMSQTRTMVMFESPHRVADSLGAMAEAWGADRLAAVSRELTKLYEETKRGTLAELAAWASAAHIKGEIVVCVGGRPPTEASMDVLVDEAVRRIESGEKTAAVVADIANAARVVKRDLYAQVLAARQERSAGTS